MGYNDNRNQGYETLVMAVIVPVVMAYEGAQKLVKKGKQANDKRSPGRGARRKDSKS